MFITRFHYLCVLFIVTLLPMAVSSHAISKEVYQGSCDDGMQATEKELGKPTEIQREETDYIIHVSWSYPQLGFKKEFWWVKDNPNECSIDSAVIHGLGGNVYCHNAMKDVEEENGKPEKIEVSDYETYGYISWLYPFKGLKVIFRWKDSDGNCEISNNDIPFSKAGLAAKNKREKKELEDKIKSMRAEHPRWSYKVCKAIIQSKVFLGMTKEQVIESWGEPANKNVTIVTSGRHEQWVYHNRYLYFDNNLLTGMQSNE